MSKSEYRSHPAKFIVIEGIDGSGKSTVAKMLSTTLAVNGFKVWLTAEPTKGPVGQLIRQNLKEVRSNPIVDALLFAADRAVHTHEILEKMASGCVVISDRYLLSSLVYQSCQGLDVEWVRKINKMVITPNVEFILDCPPAVAYDRLCKTGKDKEKFETPEWLQKLAFGYGMLYDSQILVNAERTPELVLDDIVRTLAERKIVTGDLNE